MHKLLCAAFLWAERKDLILRNPTRLIDKKLVKKSESDPQKIRALTDSEFDRIVELVDAREDRALWLVLLTTGVRVGEMAGLKWESVDLDAGHAAGRERHRRVSPAAPVAFPGPAAGHPHRAGRAAAQDCALGAGGGPGELCGRGAAAPPPVSWWQQSGLPLPEWVFTMPDRRPMAQHHVNRLWHQIQDQVGIPTDRQMGLHGCRRTVATHDAQVGEPKAQQDKLGHVNQATTDTYVTAGQARLREHTDRAPAAGAGPA